MNSNLDTIRNRIAMKHIALATEKTEKALEPRIIYPMAKLTRKTFKGFPRRLLVLG